MLDYLTIMMERLRSNLFRSTLGENPKQDEVTFTARPVLDEDNSEQDLENLERAIAEMDEYFEAIREPTKNVG